MPAHGCAKALSDGNSWLTSVNNESDPPSHVRGTEARVRNSWRVRLLAFTRKRRGRAGVWRGGSDSWSEAGGKAFAVLKETLDARNKKQAVQRFARLPRSTNLRQKCNLCNGQAEKRGATPTVLSFSFFYPLNNSPFVWGNTAITESPGSAVLVVCLFFFLFYLQKCLL